MYSISIDTVPLEKYLYREFILFCFSKSSVWLGHCTDAAETHTWVQTVALCAQWIKGLCVRTHMLCSVCLYNTSITSSLWPCLASTCGMFTVNEIWNPLMKYWGCMSPWWGPHKLYDQLFMLIIWQRHKKCQICCNNYMLESLNQIL